MEAMTVTLIVGSVVIGIVITRAIRNRLRDNSAWTSLRFSRGWSVPDEREWQRRFEQELRDVRTSVSGRCTQ